MKLRRLRCGWCMSARSTGNATLHDRCPGLIREAHVTPKGKVLSEIRCTCRCKADA